MGSLWCNSNINGDLAQTIDMTAWRESKSFECCVDNSTPITGIFKGPMHLSIHLSAIFIDPYIYHADFDMPLICFIGDSFFAPSHYPV